MDQLKNLLSALYSECDQKKRVNIEIQLAQLGTDIASLIKALLEIIKQNDQSLKNSHVKTSAAIYLREFIRTNTSNKKIQCTDFLNLAILIIQYCMDSDVDILLVDHLAMNLDNLLRITPQNDLITFIQAIILKVKEFMDIGQTNFICAGFSIFNIISSTCIELQENMITDLILKIHEIAIAYCQKSIDGLDKINAKLLKGETNFQNEKSYSIELIKIIYAYSRFLSSCLEKQKQVKYKFFDNFSLSSPLSNFLGKCLKISFPATIQPDSFFSSSSILEVDNSINYFKYKIQNCVNLILMFIEQISPNMSILKTPFYNLCQELLPLYTNTILSITRKPDLDVFKIIEGGIQGNMIMEMLKTFNILLETSKDFFAFIAENKFYFIIEIIFVFLRASPKEISDLQNDPKGFVQFSLDICEKQESETCKTEAAKLLEEFCDHIDGCVTFVSLITSNAIDYCMSDQKNIDNYECLKPFKNTMFFSRTSAELIIDTCILVMTNISYLTPRRKDIFFNFESVVKKHVDKLFKESTLLIQCRLALMLGYYADVLFDKDELKFHMILNFLIDCLTYENEKGVLALQSADTLKTIMIDVDIIIKIEATIGNYLDKFCKIMEVTKMPEVFEIILGVITTYSEVMDNSNVTNLLNTLTKRIMTEFELCKNNNTKTNIIITHCWNVIRAIVEQNCFYPIMIDEIENKIIPLFNFMTKPQEIDFDDDIISVASTLIQKRHEVSEPYKTFFVVLNLTYEKYRGYLKPLIYLYNNYLQNGSKFFKENPQNMNTLVQIGLNSLFSNEEPVESNNADAAILVQLILQYIDPIYLGDFLPSIIASVIKRLDASPTTNSLHLQLFNVIFSSFCSDSERTMILLETQGYFIKFFEKLNEKFELIRNSYDRKLLVIGLSNVLMIINLYESNKKVYTDIMLFILKILQRQNAEDINKRSKIDKKVINLEDDEDEDDSDDSSDEINRLILAKTNGGAISKNKKDSKNRLGPKGSNLDDDDDAEDIDSKYDTLNSIISKIQKIDEYAFFTASLRHAERVGINLDSLHDLIGPIMFDFLKNVVSCMRISIHVNNNEISTIRKLVIAKRMIPKNEAKAPNPSHNSNHQNNFNINNKNAAENLILPQEKKNS